MLKLSQFTYNLPEELIAHSPIEPRDHSRLLVVDRATGKFSHHHYYDLPELMDSNSVLVRNNTKVLPARLFGKKTTGGLIELLLIKRVKIEADSETWEVLSKPGIKLGQKVIFENTDLTTECIGSHEYTRLVKFNQGGQQLFESFHQIGQTPIPPYIHWNETDEQKIRDRYQTVYAKIEGSAAAPTAGLHFTPELDRRLLEKGVEIIEITLHVGLGTFLPVKVEDITTHPMHGEQYVVTEEAAERLNAAKKSGKKIVAVGTTTARTLETCADESGSITTQTGETAIFIYPPYRFKFVDCLITNFHLPESTLLMMVSALVSQPNTDQEFANFQDSLIGKAYTEAIHEKYRFYSFGDGMWIR